MRKYTATILSFLFILILSKFSSGQDLKHEPEMLSFRKKEINTGMFFRVSSEREELISELSESYEEINSGSLNFQINSRSWNFSEVRQEKLNFDIQLGPYGGMGNWKNITDLEESYADHTIYGIRAWLSADYAQRYYYTRKNYTIVQAGGWARQEWYHQDSEGTSIDSLGVASGLDHKSGESKFRYGMNAKAGWGFGRLNPVNHLMLAQYIIEKYYPGRLFSEAEILQIVSEIERLKDQRSPRQNHDTEKEVIQLGNFLNEKMFLTRPEGLLRDWEQGEFEPRFDGSRFEMGPFFRYYNREPDFIYGAYVMYENYQYDGWKKNRDFSAGIKYNSYKKQDWLTSEIKIGWSWYTGMKSRFNLGVMYIPGFETNNFFELSNFSHAIVPYTGCYSQLTTKTRLNLQLSYRISDDKKMVMPGPEISLAFYRSRY